MVNSIYLLKLSGFLWWVLVRFCKTDLKEEQSKEKAGRNFLVFGTNNIYSCIYNN